MNEYDVNDASNYLKESNYNLVSCLNRYTLLIDEFLNTLSLKLYNNYKFLLVKGIENIYHVFNILLLYSNNLDFTYYNTQRCYLYYLEFIQQIKSESNNILNLNIKEASIFIYKKLILKKHANIIDNNNINIIDSFTQFYNNIIYNLIYNSDNLENANKT